MTTQQATNANFRRFTVLFTILATLAGCTKSTSVETMDTREEEMTLPLLDAKSVIVNDDKALVNHPLRDQLMAKFIHHENVPVSQVLDVIFENHANDQTGFGQPTVMFLNGKELNAKIESLLTASNDPSELKVAYEKQIEKENNELLQYNLHARNLRNIFQDSRLQSYSGTILNSAIYKKSLHGKVDSRVAVIIFEMGHMLPGFIIGNSGSERLYGVETTVRGRGLVDYGWTRDLAEKATYPLRIVLMNDFLMMDAVKGSLRLNADQFSLMKNSMLRKLEQYGIDDRKLEDQILKAENSSMRIDSAMTLTKRAASASPRQFKSEVKFEGELDKTPFDIGAAEVDSTDHTLDSFDLASPIGFNVTKVDPSALAVVSEEREKQIARSQLQDQPTKLGVENHGTEKYQLGYDDTLEISIAQSGYILTYVKMNSFGQIQKTTVFAPRTSKDELVMQFFRRVLKSEGKIFHLVALEKDAYFRFLFDGEAMLTISGFQSYGQDQSNKISSHELSIKVNSNIAHAMFDAKDTTPELQWIHNDMVEIVQNSSFVAVKFKDAGGKEITSAWFERNDATKAMVDLLSEKGWEMEHQTEIQKVSTVTKTIVHIEKRDNNSRDMYDHARIIFQTSDAKRIEGGFDAPVIEKDKILPPVNLKH